LTPVQKRAAVAQLRVEADYPLTGLCRLVGLSRSSYYYRPMADQSGELVSALKEVARRFPTYGSRRITWQLRRAPQTWWVNRKRIQRLMRLWGLLKVSRRRPCRTTDSAHGYPRYPNRVKELRIVRPDQVWVSDITYIRLGNGFVYLAVIMDVFTRAIRGWQLSRALDGHLTVQALRRALVSHRPEIHHSDQGVQYAAQAYIELLKAHQVQVSMAAIGQATENGYAERLMRTIKEEEVDLSEYRTFTEAVAQLGHFIDEVYAIKRIHSALGYLTPVEFETAWRMMPPVELVPLSSA
jgi:putative transposase